MERRDGLVDLAATAARMPASDLDAALLMVAERPGELHYAPGPGRWYIWDGKCHRPDDSDQAGQLVQALAWRYGLAIGTVRGAVRDEVTSELDPSVGEAAVDLAVRRRMEPFEAAAKYAAALRKNAGRMALLRELATVCATDEAALNDRWPHHLNCANGIVDLRTGAVHRHDPRAMMTYCLDVAYNPAARGPEWDNLVWHVGRENPNVVRHLAKTLGYAMLGDNPEQLIVFLAGPTASGKTVLLDVVASVLGQLAHNSSGALISVGKNDRNARVENSIAGKRLVTITETAERLTIDEGQVKRLTGESRISRNRHYAAEEIDTPVSWLILVATNEMPTLMHCDDAMRRRVVVVPCGDTVPEELRDKSLRARICAREAEAVLATLVWGAMTYAAEGLAPPVEVAANTDAYVAEQDTISAFLEECTSRIDPAMLNGQGWARQGPARRLYVQWCRQNRIRTLGTHTFNKLMREHPGIIWNENRKWYEGIILVSPQAVGIDEDEAN